MKMYIDKFWKTEPQTIFFSKKPFLVVIFRYQSPELCIIRDIYYMLVLNYEISLK